LLITSFATGSDHSPPARAPFILTAERLAGGCILYKLGREPRHDCFGDPTQPVEVEASDAFSLARLIKLSRAREQAEEHDGPFNE
jgi:hypothetical protein